jgi:multiple sugar transport system substrate-binding protein
MMHKWSRRALLRTATLVAASGVVGACQPKVVEVTREVPKEITKIVQQVVKETVVIQGTPKVVEKEVTRVIEKVATAQPKEITLSVPNIWGGSRVPMMEDMFKRFSQVHPGLKVENVLVPGAELLQKLQTAIAAGTPPDVPMVNQAWVPSLAKRKTLMPLDSFMARDKVAVEEYYNYAIYASQWEGKVMTLPNASAAWAMFFYNVDQFKEVGLDPAKPPETWADLIAASKKLTKGDGKKINRIGYQFYNGLPGLDDFKQALIANNGKFYSDDGRKIAWNSQEGLDGIKFMIQCMKDAYGTTEAYADWSSVQGAQDVTGPFLTGTASSRLGGVWEIFYILSGKPDLNYLVSVPQYGPAGKARVPAQGSWSYGIPVGVKNADASWELVEWLCHEPTAACWFMQQQGRPSPVKSCNEDKYYLNTFPKTWPNVIKMLDVATYIPVTPADAEIAKKLTTAIEEAVRGVKPPQDALAASAKECQAVMDEGWK